MVETDEAGRSTREFGVITTEASNLVYQSRWALDRAQERAAFEWLIDMTFERLAHFPDLYVYHFWSYESGAIKRLMLRYATREEEVSRRDPQQQFLAVAGTAR